MACPTGKVANIIGEIAWRAERVGVRWRLWTEVAFVFLRTFAGLAYSFHTPYVHMEVSTCPSFLAVTGSVSASPQELRNFDRCGR